MRPRSIVVVLLVAASVLAACVEPPATPLGAPATLQWEDLELPEVAATSLERRAQEVTVRVRSLGCEQFGLGSGFMLPGGVVVTNRHVIEQPREVTVNTWDGRSLPTEVRGVATDSDLALLQLEDPGDLPVAELRTAPVQRGEQVFAVGYPGGGPAQISPGRVLGMVDGTVLGEPAEVIRVEVEIAQGSSGGPLVDHDGLVVGVVFAIEVDAGIGLAVPVATLLERLDSGELVPPEAC